MTAMESHHLPVRRTARYWTLGPASGASVIWVVCHGYGQLAGPFLEAFRHWDDGSRLIVAPEGLSRYYVDHGAGAVGATWMTREDRLVDIEDYVAYLDDLIEAVRERAVPDAPVHVLGFSQGTHTVCRWAAFGRVRPARLILWGSGVPPDLDLAGPGRALAEYDLTVALGRTDRHITSEMVAREEARLTEAGIPYTLRWYDAGHRLHRETLDALVQEE
jgi:predicted esterase